MLCHKIERFKELRRSGFTYYQIAKAIGKYFSDEITQNFSALATSYNRLRYPGVRVLDEKWDYLIVLDACRYDVFKKVNTIRGKLKKRFSLGTHTADWTINNFKGRKVDDIVYISGTPQISEVILKNRIGVPNPFFHLEKVWDWGWDDNLGTVHPKKVNEAVLKLKDIYKGKRTIIHYLQPHNPFIGKPMLKGKWFDEVNKTITIEEVKNAYIGNLKLVLDYVSKIINKLNGKIVITADHGEAFGEYGIYSHHPKLYIKPLMEIPWLEIERV